MSKYSRPGALKALIYACHYIFARTSIAIGAVPHEVTALEVTMISSR